jgi:CheY-like chemotaxis protein
MPRSSAVLTVADSGPGIPDDVLARVFEPGFTTKTGEHSGLGLATVWRIVDRWQGSIDIESSPTTGTTVRVEFPLFDHTARRRALVVVADARARQMLVEELGERDFDVIAAGDALEACDSVMGQRPVDLALLDQTSGTDPGLATVAQLAKVDRVQVLGRDGVPERRIPTNRVDAAQLVSAAITPLPRVPAG